MPMTTGDADGDDGDTGAVVAAATAPSFLARSKWRLNTVEM